MKSHVVSISQHDHWADYADDLFCPLTKENQRTSEYFVVPEVSERTMADTWRSFLVVIGTLIGWVVMGGIAWFLLWAGLEGWKSMNAVTGWIEKAVGL